VVSEKTMANGLKYGKVVAEIDKLERQPFNLVGFNLS
jgi:hypothetical protein